MTGGLEKGELDYILACIADPSIFAREALGLNLTKKQQQILRSVFRNKVTAVRAPSSLGKSFIAGVAVTSWSQLFCPSTAVTTAPGERQLKDNIWQDIATIRNQAKAPLKGKLSSLRMVIDEDAKWFAEGFTTGDYNAAAAKKMEGYHNEHVLVVVEEASAVSDIVFDSVDKLMVQPHCHLLMIGNPDFASGRFYRAFEDRDAVTFSMDFRDSPNICECEEENEDLIPFREAFEDRGMHLRWESKVVSPHFLTLDWCIKQLKDRGPEDPFCQIYVFGSFPDSSDEQMFSEKLITRAMDGEEPEPTDSDNGNIVQVGLDVAHGGDANVSMVRDGMQMECGFRDHVADHTSTRRKAQHLVKKINADALVIDATGEGSGPADELMDWAYREENVKTEVVRFSFGGSAQEPEKYYDAGTEAYFWLRDYMRQGGKLPNDADLKKDLRAVRWTFQKRGGEIVHKLLSKKQRKKLAGGKSPDEADACALATYPLSFLYIDEELEDDGAPVKMEMGGRREDDNLTSRGNQSVRDMIGSSSGGPSSMPASLIDDGDDLGC